MDNELIGHRQDMLRFIHITDTHLLNTANETFHQINTKKNLQTVLAHCSSHYRDVDFWLFTGNHDTPKLLQNVAPECPIDAIRVIPLGKFSLVLISTWVADEHYGKISQRCLGQLQAYLQTCKDQFNVIVLHHPPVPVNSRWLDEIGLQNKNDFLQVLGSYPDKLLVLFGHVHQAVDQQLEKLRFLSTPSTCHQFKPNTHIYRTDRLPPAYRFVELTTHGQIDTKIHYLE